VKFPRAHAWGGWLTKNTGEGSKEIKRPKSREHSVPRGRKRGVERIVIWWMSAGKEGKQPNHLVGEGSINKILGVVDEREVAKAGKTRTKGKSTKSKRGEKNVG